MIKVTDDKGDVSNYDYYYDGLRRSKTIEGKTTTFYYEGLNIVAEIDESDNGISNIYGINLIARSGAENLYYKYNGHADVVEVEKQDGSLANSYDYDIFGNIIKEVENAINPYKYSGYYSDSETGYYYLKTRYYNPKIARFITEDSYSGEYTDPLSLNKYTYVHNNPVTGYDPTGMWLDTVFDVISVVKSVVDVVKNPRDWRNWAALGADVLSTLVPGFTGGGNLVRATKLIDNAYGAAKSVKTVKTVNKVADTAKTINKTVDTAKAIDKTKDSTKALDLSKKTKELVDPKATKKVQAELTKKIESNKKPLIMDLQLFGYKKTGSSLNIPGGGVTL